MEECDWELDLLSHAVQRRMLQLSRSSRRAQLTLSATSEAHAALGSFRQLDCCDGVLMVIGCCLWLIGSACA
eukprot:536936-Pleurochrysis_carterae.AAC.1